MDLCAYRYKVDDPNVNMTTTFMNVEVMNVEVSGDILPTLDDGDLHEHISSLIK